MRLSEKIKNNYANHFSNDLHQGFFEASGFSNLGYWDETTSTGKEAATNLVDKLLEFIPDKSGTILDVACGQGGTTRRLQDYYEPSHITAINLDPKQIEVAAKNAEGSNFHVMDAAQLAFEPCSFDNIICVEAACHFNTREKFFGEAYRVLKPGGRLVMSDIIFRRFTMYLPDVMTGEKMMPNANHILSMAVFETQCRNAGFEHVEVQDIAEQSWKTFLRRWSKFRRGRETGSWLTKAKSNFLFALWVCGWSYMIGNYIIVSAQKRG